MNPKIKLIWRKSFWIKSFDSKIWDSLRKGFENRSKIIAHRTTKTLRKAELKTLLDSWRSTFSKHYTAASAEMEKIMQSILIFSLLALTSAQEMQDLYCGDMNCYEGNLLFWQFSQNSTLPAKFNFSSRFDKRFAEVWSW